MPFNTKSHGSYDPGDEDAEEELDDVIQPEPDFDAVYAVPRSGKCTSGKIIHFINLFGNKGCIKAILDLFEKDNKQHSIQTMMNLITIVSQPAVLYHKGFIEEHGAKIIKIIK